MKHIWLKGALVGAAVLMGSNGIRAEETIAGAAVQLRVHNLGSGQWSPYINDRGYGKNGDGNNFWIDVGTKRLLTGVNFNRRAEENLSSRWKNFRVWGTNNREDVAAAQKDTSKMTLVVSNYLGVAAATGTYNTLIPDEGVGEFRYYYLSDLGGYASFHGFELWSASPSVWEYAPIVDDLDEGNYTFRGKVSYVEGDAGEICVAIADKDYDDDFAAWQGKGRIVKSSETYQTGDAFSIEVKGVARGRTYSRVFVRAGSDGEWFAACRTWYFSARAEIMTLEAYVVDTADQTKTNAEGQVTGYNEAYRFYDGKTSNGWVEYNTGVSSIIFKLDPTKDYSSIRVYPRVTGVNNQDATCFSRVMGLYPYSVTEDDLEFTGAEQSTFVEAPRKLYFVKPTGVSSANWTAIDSLATTLKDFADWSGSYIELPIPKGTFTGKKWLKIDVNDGSTHTNCREIELLTVAPSSFCLRIQ